MFMKKMSEQVVFNNELLEYNEVSLHEIIEETMDVIEETENLGDVIILKDKYLIHQEPKKFDQFIKENYEPVDEVGNLIVYRKKE